MALRQDPGKRQTKAYERVTIRPRVYVYRTVIPGKYTYGMPGALRKWAASPMWRRPFLRHY